MTGQQIKFKERSLKDFPLDETLKVALTFNWLCNSLFALAALSMHIK